MLLLLKISGVLMTIYSVINTFLGIGNLFGNLNLIMASGMPIRLILVSLISIVFWGFQLYVGFRGAICYDSYDDIEACESLGKILLVVYVIISILNFIMGEFSLTGFLFAMLIPVLYYVAARLNLY